MKYILLVLSILVAALIIVGLFTGVIPIRVETRVVGAPVCQAASTKGLEFNAKVRGNKYTAITESNSGKGIVYRHQPKVTSDYDVAGRLLPGNCQIGFVGFCIGQAVKDLSGGQAKDQQWFILPDGKGYVAGAVVQEIPPGTIGQTPSPCPGGSPEPMTITVDPKPVHKGNRLQLDFNAPDAVTIGAAIQVTDSHGKGWQQIGLDTDNSDGFQLVWSPNTDLSDQVTIFYAACWAGNVPGRATGSSSISGTRVTTAPLSEDEARQAASIACYQDAGGT
jgi:hypothetical protein